jgi:DNA-binding GntR family transcriptional regulator
LLPTPFIVVISPADLSTQRQQYGFAIAMSLDIVYTAPMAITSYAFGNPLLGRQSSPEIIVESLRRAIIEGHLRPGESLRQENLAKHFAVSRIPVREALRQLESEGWVVLQPNYGARVTTLSAEEVREIYEIRASLEVTALRLAAPHHTAQSLEAIASILSRSHSALDQSLYAQHNREFHLALYLPAQRPRLFALIDSLHSQGERYLQLKLTMPAHKQQSDDEHELIFEAVRSGKIDEAVRILETHLLQTGNLLANYLTRQLAKRAGNLKGKVAKSAAA